jgi:hypothetical protein
MPFDLDRKIGFFFAAAFAGTLFAISTAWLIAGRAGNQGPVILSGLIGVDGTDEICRGSIDIAGIQGRVKQPRLVSAATQSRSVSQSVPLENERGPAGSPSLLVPRAHAGERNFRHHVPHMMPAGMPDHRETGGSATFTEPAWIGAAIPDAENANQERQEHAPRQPVERSHSAAMRPDPGEQAGMPAPTHNNTAHHRVGQTHLSMPPRQALSGGPDHGSHEQKGGPWRQAVAATELCSLHRTVCPDLWTPCRAATMRT